MKSWKDIVNGCLPQTLKRISEVNLAWITEDVEIVIGPEEQIKVKDLCQLEKSLEAELVKLDKNTPKNKWEVECTIRTPSRGFASCPGDETTTIEIKFRVL